MSGVPDHKASLTELVMLLDEKLAELRRIVRDTSQTTMTTSQILATSMSGRLPQMAAADGDWQAVAAEVRRRMDERKITTAELARRTALSETTIRSVRKGTDRHEGHTLIVLAACLGLHNQYLRESASRTDSLPSGAAYGPRGAEARRTADRGVADQELRSPRDGLPVVVTRRRGRPCRYSYRCQLTCQAITACRLRTRWRALTLSEPPAL